MKIYIVVNNANTVDSSYFDVLEVFKNKADALSCIRTCADDFVEAYDEGYSEGFDNYVIITGKDSIKIVNDPLEEIFEEWYIEEKELI